MSDHNTSMDKAFEYFTNYRGDSQKVQRKHASLMKERVPEAFDEYRRFLARLDKPDRETYTMPRPAICAAPPITELVLDKSAVLAVLDDFERAGCLAIKICFGMDKCHNLQLIVSGSFHVPVGKSPKPAYVDNFFQTTVLYHKKPQARVRRYLNFGKRLRTSTASSLMRRFRKATAPQKKLLGYMLDIATFNYFLSNPDTLGIAKQIKFKFGMNDAGMELSNLENARIMILAVSATDPATSSCVFYLDKLATMDNDDTENPTCCPPREPCNAEQ